MRASARPLAATTFVEVLRLRAEESPDAVGYVFLGDDDGLRQMTYGGLDLRSRALAANLQQLGLAGERVLIVHPPGLDYVAAFFGCMYAGCVPVPSYPPDGRTDRGIERLHAVAASASPRAIVTTSHLAQRLRDVANAVGRSDLLMLVSPVADESLAATWRAPATSAADLAFLQYSSGSTGSPKGVCLSQANLMHNSELIRRAFGHDRTSRGVIWLPPYHDMGLIGGILQPLYVGFPVLLFSPVTFLLRPARWLRAVSAFRATTSGGPNFAYDLCVRRVTEAEKDGLDLSSWDVAFTGAEPVRSSTLERFTRAFERCGFRPEALQPCYGLAEATLIVSGGEKGRGPVALTLSREQLEGHSACQAHDREPSEQVVACGRVMDDMELAIVEAENGTPLPDGRVGEIWVRGPSVARGYWRLPEENAATFEGRLRGDAGPAFLRTGDLGFQREGRLYITGRLKDLIIVRGRNLYPQDIEAAAETSHPLLRPGGGAAFSVERDGEERLVVVHEVHRHFKPEAGGDVRDAVRAAISETFEVAAWAVELIPPRVTAANLQRQGAAWRLSRPVPHGSPRVMRRGAGDCRRRGGPVTRTGNRVAPGPTGYAWVRSLIGVHGPHPIPHLLEWTRRYGDIVRVRIGLAVFHLLNDLPSARHVLQDNYRNYTKSRNFDEIRRVLGNGLLTSEGDFWLRQRRLAQPAFHPERLAACTDAIVEATDRRLSVWARTADLHEALDVQEEMLGLTLGIVGHILLGVDLGREERTVGTALTLLMRHVNRRIKSLLPLPASLPTPGERRFRRALRTLDELVVGIIRERAASKHDRGDLLSMLLAARDADTGEGMSEAQVRDEVMTLLLAGHETTADALSWTFHLLAQHEDIQQRLHREIDEVLGSRPPRYADLPALSYARQVLQEAMRLYPPAWLIERQVIADDEVGGFRIPAGSMVAISPYTLHRNPALWPDSERFDPDRFRPEATAERSRFAYLPFGAGPRVCIGAGLAMLDAHVILVMVAQRFRLATDPAHVVDLEPLTTLRPRTGVRVRLSHWQPHIHDVVPNRDSAQPGVRSVGVGA